MTIWVLHVAPPETRPAGLEGKLGLPLHGLPDYTHATFGELRLYLRSQNPDAPPEAISREAERIRRYTHTIGSEDILALPINGQVAFAEALSGVKYEEGEYRVPVRWLADAPLRRFGKHRDIFADGGDWLQEVQDPKARALIRDRLPLRGNRFSNLKWILGAVAALQFFYFALHMWKSLRW